MKTKLEIIPGPYRVCEEKHGDGTLIIRSHPRGDGDVPGDLTVALIVGGAPGEYDRNTAELLASAPEMRAAIVEYVAASMVNVPSSRVQDAWQKLCAFAAPPNVAVSNAAPEPRPLAPSQPVGTTRPR